MISPGNSVINGGSTTSPAAGSHCKTDRLTTLDKAADRLTHLML